MLKIKKIQETSDVYDITVKDNNNFYANNILVHNCLEVNHPLSAIKDVSDKNGEIGVCILSAVNLLEVSKEEMSSVCDVIVRMLDELIDHQNYFVPAAANFAQKRRSLGVGVTNLAAYLAKNKIKYFDKEAPNKAAAIMELISFNLIKASVELAKEKGPCEKFNLTKYSQGVLPIDNYCKSIDEFVTEKLHCDWESLRSEIKEYGMRHSTLTALMPVESSSVIQSSTNGIEPPRSLVSFKRSKAGIMSVVVPNIKEHKNDYTLAFEMPSNEGYLKVVGALQKFVDMSISTNLYYNTVRYPNKIPPQTELVRDILLAYKYGIKNLYYTNTFDGDTQTVLDEKKEVKQAPLGSFMFLGSTDSGKTHLAKTLAVETIETQQAEETDGCSSGACAI